MLKVTVVLNGDPTSGGGSTLIRSQLNYLQHDGFEFTVLCLSPAFETIENWSHLSNPFIMKPGLAGFANLFALSARVPLSKFHAVINKILQTKPDCFWVVANDDGALIASELKRRSPTTPLHLTIHDHLGKTVFSRSKRYRFFSFLGTYLQNKAIQAADSCDVVAESMATEARTICTGPVIVAHRALPPLLPMHRSLKDTSESDMIVVGHIGSVYDIQMFRSFLTAFHLACRKLNKRSKLILIGRKSASDVCGIIDEVDCQPQLSGEESVNLLCQADLLYCQHPLRKSMRSFALTSFPTKVSTYLPTGRKIFYHGPTDAEVAEYIRKFDLGLTTDASSEFELAREVDNAIQMIEKPFENYALACEARFGYKNVDRIGAAIKSHCRP